MNLVLNVLFYNYSGAYNIYLGLVVFINVMQNVSLPGSVCIHDSASLSLPMISSNHDNANVGLQRV